MTGLQSLKDHNIVSSTDAVGLEALTDLALRNAAVCGREDQLGRVVRLARNIFSAPIAVLTLIDGDRHEVHRESGLEAAKALPEIAFFDRTLLSNEPLVVRDTRLDPHFHNCASVRNAPFIRSYLGVPLVDRSGALIGTIGVFDTAPRDVSPMQLEGLVDLAHIAMDELRLKGAKREAEDTRRQLFDAIEALPDGFILFDEDDRLAVYNSRMLELYAESGKYLEIGRTFEEIMRDALGAGMFPDAVGREEIWLQDRLRNHRNPTGLIEQQTVDGRWLRIYEKKTPSGATVGFRVDITELKLREAELFELATRDSLTGVLTRRAVLDEIQREFGRLVRYPGVCSVLLLDVDHFKGVNDIFGHQTGDEVLRRICRQIDDSCRDVDRVGRLGGEEFLILLPDTDLRGALVTAERLRADIARLSIACADRKDEVSVTVSIGASEFKLGESSENTLARADHCLYQAKLEGRNCVHGDMDDVDWQSAIG